MRWESLIRKKTIPIDSIYSSAKKMPINEATSSGKNKLGLTLPEVPRDSNEQNHSENGYDRDQAFLGDHHFCWL